jgi:hypothetical protein
MGEEEKKDKEEDGEEEKETLLEFQLLGTVLRDFQDTPKFFWILDFYSFTRPYLDADIAIRN